MSTKKPATGSAPTLASLRAKHDPLTVTKAKVEAQLTKLRAQGPEAWQYEVDFLRAAGIGNTHISLIREPYRKFTAEVHEIGKKSARTVWFHDAKFAAVIRKEQAAQNETEA